MSQKSTSDLKTETNSTVFDNNSALIEAADHNDLIKNILDSVFNKVDDKVGTFEHDQSNGYLQGQVVVKNGSIYKANKDISSGTAFNETDWDYIGNDFILNLVAADSPFTATTHHSHFACDATNGPITIELPSPANGQYKRMWIIKTDSSNNDVLVDPGADKLDGSTNTQTITGQYRLVEVISNGNEWFSVQLKDLARNLEDLTRSVIEQIKKIKSVTVSNTQWGYLGGLDQALDTAASVAFASAALSGELDMNTNKIINVKDPTNAQDAATRSWVMGLIDKTLKPPEAYDPTGTGNFPTTYGGESVERGDTFRITAAYDGIGSSSVAVNVDDLLISLTDNPSDTNIADWQIAESNREQATEALKGVLEIATNTETNNETDDKRAVTPKKLGDWWSQITVALTHLANISDDSMLVNISGGSASPSERTLSAMVDGASLQYNTTSHEWEIPDNGVSKQKFENVADDTVLGRIGAGGSGDVKEEPVADFSDEQFPELNAENFRGQDITISDDSVATITPVNTAGQIVVTDKVGSSASMVFDLVNGARSEAASLGVAVTTTGTLNGTTGTDGKMTVSAASDGKIYIENRTGSQITARTHIVS